MFRPPHSSHRNSTATRHRAVHDTPSVSRFVVMGVCGAGKSLVGEALARALGVEFVEGDRYHPPANVARMAAGIPLTDDDRRDWLAALACRLRQSVAEGTGVVMSCSALRRTYRDLLRTGAPDARFVYLHGGRDLLAARLSARTGHFMPASLLDSQLATLEEPSPDEHALTCDVSEPVETIVASLVRRAST